MISITVLAHDIAGNKLIGLPIGVYAEYALGLMRGTFKMQCEGEPKPSHGLQPTPMS
jgi:hypothetical protein